MEDDSVPLAILFSMLSPEALQLLPPYLEGQTQHSWYQQVRSLTNIDIRWQSNVNWKERYKTLSESLHSLGYNSSMSKDELLYLAAANGHTDIVRLLLEEGEAEPSVRNSMSIRLASENGHAEIVHLLLVDGRADPTALDNYCLKQAIEERRMEVVRILLEDDRILMSGGRETIRPKPKLAQVHLVIVG